MSTRAIEILKIFVDAHRISGTNRFDTAAFMHDGLALRELQTHGYISIVQSGIIEYAVLHPETLDEVFHE